MVALGLGDTSLDSALITGTVNASGTLAGAPLSVNGSLTVQTPHGKLNLDLSGEAQPGSTDFNLKYSVVGTTETGSVKISFNRLGSGQREVGRVNLNFA